MMRSRLLTVVALAFVAAFALLWLCLPRRPSSFPRSYPFLRAEPAPAPKPLDPPVPAPAPKPLDPPVLHNNVSDHAVTGLLDEAERDFDAVLARQSRSLEDAVREYRRRYGIHPPPHFDRWYQFALRRGVRLVDEFDGIHHALLPFWALVPSTIRARTKEALGFDNNLIGMAVRDGRVVLAEGVGATAWHQKAVVGMMASFVADLPDMDIAFNVHDEPRVLVPYDDLSRLVAAAKDMSMPAAAAVTHPSASFSPRPADLGDGMNFSACATTRFNHYAHQSVWAPSRLSCAPGSPARSLDEPPARDDGRSYALGELGFVFNATAFSDICLTPSLRESYGFFDRPNAFDVVHDLFPIFSQSKVSSFQDILYPSPWYWVGKVNYTEERDVDWDQKDNRMYWRGSTTGGFSRDGGWRRQHRQRAVARINANDTARVLARGHHDHDHDHDHDESPSWHATNVRREDYGSLFDVKFSHVGQCDPDDCEAQRSFFDVAEVRDQQDAWRSRFLLDMDGNAFSGRFYAFLRSKSLVYKLAIFREWHHDWLKPWLHYIPWSLRGDEYVETVRYFAQEEEGRARAPRLADRKRDWAQRALRNEDLEAWFFRLLLE